MDTTDKILEFAFLDELSLKHQILGLSSIINILFAALIGFLIIGIYVLTTDKGKKDFSLIQSIPVLAMLMAVIMKIDGSKAVMFFGIFGILSIVRFRSELTDQKGITFILFSIIMGLLAGIGNYFLAVISFLIIAVVIFIVRYIFVHTRYKTAKITVRGNENIYITKTKAESIFHSMEIDYNYFSCREIKLKTEGWKREVEYLLHFHNLEDIFSNYAQLSIALGNAGLELEMEDKENILSNNKSR